MKVYLPDGQVVEGTLTVDGIAIEDIERTPFFQAVAATEWDLIRRYDRGEL